MAAQNTELVLNGNTNLDIPPEFLRAHNIPMGYLDQLKTLRKRKGYTQDALAQKVGVEQPTIGRWEKGSREPSLSQLIELAEILEVEPGDLINPHLVPATGPRLYVKGEVAAGLWREAYELPETEWRSFTGREGVTAKLDHRFGLRVIGDSMNIPYPEGTIIECVSVFGHAEIVPGRRVVVVRKNDRNEVEATVKTLVEQDGELWCIPESTNLAHRPFKLSEPEPGIIEVRIAAIVVGALKPE